MEVLWDWDLYRDLRAGLVRPLTWEEYMALPHSTVERWRLFDEHLERKRRQEQTSQQGGRSFY